MLNMAAMNREPPIVDRLSSLSDDIICDILSFLPTKDAAVTSVLSKRYRYLLARVPTIDVDFGVFRSRGFWCGDKQRRFTEFINKMLSSKARINKFRIQNTSSECSRTVLSFVDSWILEAIKRKVQMLDIGQNIFGNDSVNLGFLPNEIFDCKTLVSLKLFITGPIDVGEGVDLPNLKELSLSFAKNINADMFTKSLHDLLPGCPMLEDLGIQCLISANFVHVVYISIPSLKRLRLDLGCESPEFIVDTPNLLHFDYIFTVHKKIEMKNPNSLVSAQLTILDAERLTQDFSSSIVGISGINSLSLKMYGRPVAGCSFPKFPMAKYLELHGDTYDFHESLSVILDSMPAVEFLVIDMGYKQYDGKKLNTPIAMCLSQSVKEVEYRNFSGYQIDFEPVKYILQYGKALTRMTIRLSEEVHPSGCKLIALIMSSHICPKDCVYIKMKKLPSSDEQGIACIIIQVARS